jgi:SIR2-like domain
VTRFLATKFVQKNSELWSFGFMNAELLLLGAGASKEAGIPDAKEMAKEIIKKFNANSRLEKEAKVLNFLNEQLIAGARKRSSDPAIDCVDIEELYNAILLLSEREKLEISPFVDSWLPDLSKIKELDELLGDIIFEMEMMLEGLTLIKDEKKIEYLKPILNLAGRHKKLVIATLNYDNGIELLSRASGISCGTGIETWAKKGVFEFPTMGIQLIKLHGSIYWFWSKGVRTYDERLPHSKIRFKSHFEEKLSTSILVETPMVLFGHRNKLTAEGPFLDLLKQFDEQLLQTETLTVVGYSFRDPHINFFISKFLNRYGGKIRIVDPNFEISDVEYVKYLRDLRNNRPSQIEIINKYTGDALKDLYPV